MSNSDEYFKYLQTVPTPETEREADPMYAIGGIDENGMFGGLDGPTKDLQSLLSQSGDGHLSIGIPIFIVALTGKTVTKLYKWDEFNFWNKLDD